ncbi:MAG: outer membrane beta-barrel protein [Bacteroidetes bacterium]|nr:outer membrane beta-barrel protein [Bacteroidota bacterium]
MKKPILFITVLVFCCFSLQISAQISLGIKGGYVKAWAEYGDIILPDNATIHVNRFQVSGLAYFKVNNYVSIGIEPGFAQRGAACFPGWVNFEDSVEISLLLTYLEWPLMVSVNIPVFSEKFEVFGKVGYGAARVLTAYRIDSFLEGDELPIKTRLTSGPPPFLRGLDNGIYGSLGLGYNLGQNQIFLESNYYYGMRDVERSSTSKNRSLHFALGYITSL